MEKIKAKDKIENLVTREIYVVVEEPDPQGYVEVKSESLLDTNINEIHIIHISEINDIYLKKL